jgi:hypothetical protein
MPRTFLAAPNCERKTMPWSISANGPTKAEAKDLFADRAAEKEIPSAIVDAAGILADALPDDATSYRLHASGAANLPTQVSVDHTPAPPAA